VGKGKIARRNPAIVGSGFVALDIVLSVDPTQPIRNYAGGTCGNVLAILSFLGWHSLPFVRIGRDAASALILGDLSRWKVDTRLIQREASGVLTPVIVQENIRKKNGEPTHRFSWSCPQCGSYWPSFRSITRDQAKAVPESIAGCDVFFFDRSSPGTIHLAEQTALRGALTVFEPSGIGDLGVFRRAAKASTIIKYAVDRIKKLPRDVSPLLEIRTRGKDGLDYRWQRGPWRHLGIVNRTGVIDTSGAGDWLTAGLLSKVGNEGIKTFSRLLEGNIIEALKHGQALAAWNCGFEGARGAMYHASGPSVLLRRAESLRTGGHSPKRAKQILKAALAVSRIGDVCRLCTDPATFAALAH
jgi:hypothetical protein